MSNEEIFDATMFLLGLGALYGLCYWVAKAMLVGAA